MTTTLLVIIIVMALALFFLWPIPYLGGFVAALTFLRMQPDPFNEDDADRTESRR